MAQRTPSPLPGHGPSTSRTVTQQHPHQTQTQTLQPTLRLRGASISTAEYIPQQEQQTLEDCESEDRRIRWADDVIDNEGMGKKSSKVCCIYHKPRAVGESSDESSSSSDDSDSDDDSGADDGSARPVGGRGRAPRHHGHEHDHEHGEGDDCGAGKGDVNGKGKGKSKQQRRKRSPNAYEKMPKVVKKG